MDIAIETRSRIERIAGEDGCGVSYLQFKEILNNVDGDIKKQEHFEDFICNIRYMCENEDPADHRLIFCFV